MGDQRGTRVYVGNLTDKIKKDDLEGEFTKYGKLNSVWIAFNPPGFAFVEFEHRDDAEKACDVLNGTQLLGSQLRVEISKGRPRQGRRGGMGDRGRRGDYGRRSGSGGGGFRPRGSSGGGGGRYHDRNYSSGAGGSRQSGGHNGGRDSGGSGFSRRDVYGGSSGSRDGGRSFGSSSGGGGGGGYGGGGGGRSGGGGRYRSRSPAGNHRF